MDRPYASYHFAPLVSLWFLVVYCTLKPTKWSSNSFRHVCERIVVSALLVTCLVHVPDIFEWCLFALGLPFRAKLDVSAWRYLLGTDTYVVYVGMLTALVHIQIRSLRRTPLARLSGVPRFLRRYFRVIQALTVGLGLIVLPGFWHITRRSPDEADYDWWMPYIAWMPILSFIVLRNSTRCLRSYYCAPLAWMGRMSLELYLLSHHVWLAGDGYGRLSAGFGGHWGVLRVNLWDMVILTPILVQIAWSVRSATAVVITWALGKDVEKGRVYEAWKEHGRGVEDVKWADLSRDHIVLGEIKEKREDNLSLAAKGRLGMMLVVIWIGSLIGHRGYRGAAPQ